MKKIENNYVNINPSKQIVNNSQYQVKDKVEITGPSKQNTMICYKNISMQSTLQKSLIDSDLKLDDSEVKDIMTGIKEGYQKMEKLGENVVLVVGKTGSGKSTLINYLGGVKLIGYDDNGEIKIKSQGNPIAQIGQGTSSETTMPARCEAKNFIFWDCPGFEDNRGYKQDIMNAFYVTHIVKSSEKVRICSLLKYESTTGRCNDLIEFAEQVDRLFAKEKEQYEKSLSIIITQVPEGQKITNIQKRLIKMLDEAKDSHGEPLKNKDILKDIVNSKLSIFRAPNDGESVKYDDINPIISDIENLAPITVDQNILQVAPSISTKSALAAIDLYQKLNTTIKDDLSDLINSIINQYKIVIDDKSTSKEKLQEAKNNLEKISSNLPNVITVSDLNVVVKMNEKYFEEYSNKFDSINMSQYTISTGSSNIRDIKLVDRLNGIKFLENIVLDYAKFEPIDLYKFLKEPINDLKNKVERILTNNDSKIIEQQNNERIQNQEKASKEYEAANNNYQEKKESWGTGTKVAVTLGGTGLGAGGGALAGVYIGTVGGPVGAVVGGAIGLVVGGLIALFN